MGQGLFILGTDTDVGKTFVSAAVVYELMQNGKNVAYYKPVQSGILQEDGTPAFTDTDFISDVTGLSQSKIQCAYEFKNPVSPHLAAEQEGIIIDKARLLSTYEVLKNTSDYVIVEGAGGIAVPLVRGEFTVCDLINALALPAFLVARAGVGTINHTLLTVAYAKSKGVDIKGIIINHYTGEPHEVDNLEVIEAMTGLPVVSVLSRLDAKDGDSFFAQCRSEFNEHLMISKMMALL